MSEIAFPKLSIAQKVFYDLIWSPLLTTGLEAMYTAAPYLRPFSFILNFVARTIADKLYKQMVLFIDIQAIVLVNEIHREAYNKEFVRLKLLAKDKGIDSPEFKEARENAKEALSKFVHFNAIGTSH